MSEKEPPTLPAIAETPPTPDRAPSSADNTTTYSRNNNRNNNNNRRRGPRNKQRPVNRTPRFEGRCDGLKGHIYDCGSENQADIYTRTTKEVAEYVGANCKYGSDVRRAIETLSVPKLDEPEDPKPSATRTEIRIWEKKVDELVKRESHLEQGLKTACSLVWGQCSEAMRAKVKAKST